jgi:nitroreductase
VQGDGSSRRDQRPEQPNDERVVAPGGGRVRLAGAQQLLDLASFELLAASRRTSLRLDPDVRVPYELVERLCLIATWAPNHKRTWPWRFALYTGDGRARLGETIASELEAAGMDDEAKLAKFRRKYLRAPAILVVGSAEGETSRRTRENRDATAAAVQNVLLAATAAGLASFWSSGHPEADAAVAELSGWEDGVSTVAVIYLGWPTGDVEVPTRPAALIREISG